MVSVAERMPMKTNEVPSGIVPGTIGNRGVVGNFEGGIMTSDGGSTLLQQADTVFDATGRLSSCFTGHRDPNRVEHTVDTMIFARTAPWRWRSDTGDPTGSDRSRQRDQGNPLTGSSTLDRGDHRSGTLWRLGTATGPAVRLPAGPLDDRTDPLTCIRCSKFRDGRARSSGHPVVAFP